MHVRPAPRHCGFTARRCDQSDATPRERVGEAAVLLKEQDVFERERNVRAVRVAIWPIGPTSVEPSIRPDDTEKEVRPVKIVFVAAAFAHRRHGADRAKGKAARGAHLGRVHPRGPLVLAPRAAAVLDDKRRARWVLNRHDQPRGPFIHLEIRDVHLDRRAREHIDEPSVAASGSSDGPIWCDRNTLKALKGLSPLPAQKLVAGRRAKVRQVALLWA